MIIGSSTQYLTQVQQLPKAIEKQLQKTICTFIWGDKKSPVEEDMHLVPKDLGGRGLLDIQAQNEVIQLIWLKNYLNFSPSHALWTHYADTIIAMNIPKTEKHINPKLQKNVLLQTWKTYTRSHWNNKNPIDLKNMLDIAKKYRTQMEVLTTTQEVMRQLPIWFHAQANGRI